MSKCEQMLYDIDGQRRVFISEVEESQYMGCLDEEQPMLTGTEYVAVSIVVAFIAASLFVLGSK